MSEVATEEIFDTVEEAVADVAAGRPVIVTDDESRENEGDLVVAGSKVTPETVNMMIQHARGLICVPCQAHHLRRLGIGQMVQENREAHQTDFSVSVDAAEGITTGISAYDRYLTIRRLADPEARPDDLIQPGHIFPLKAKGGGVLERAGHTEAAVDLAALAGLFPCAAICEIIADDGRMARLPELAAFKRRFGLKMISISALIEYRRQRERLVELTREQPLGTAYGPFQLKVFRGVLDGREHFALVAGELGATPALVRMHAENAFADLFKGGDEAHRGAVDRALKRIAAEGRGAFVYLRREDGGLGFLRGAEGKPGAADSTGGMDLREYGIGAQILVALGLKKIRLITSAQRTVVALDGYGLEIVERVPL